MYHMPFAFRQKPKTTGSTDQNSKTFYTYFPILFADDTSMLFTHHKTDSLIKKYA